MPREPPPRCGQPLTALKITKNTKSQVRDYGKLFSELSPSINVSQSCLLSTFLLDIVIDIILEVTDYLSNFSSFDLLHERSFVANDTILFDKYSDKIQCLLNALMNNTNMLRTSFPPTKLKMLLQDYRTSLPRLT